MSWLKESAANRETFYQDFSHLFRTPLLGVLGYIDFLFQGYAGKLTPKQMANLGLARNATLRLNQEIDTLLDIVAFDLGLITPVPERINLRDSLQELQQFYRDLAVQRKVRIVMHVPHTPFWVKADRKWLTRLFSEVLSNIFTVMPPRKTITLRLVRRNGSICAEITADRQSLRPGVLKTAFKPLRYLRRSKGYAGGNVGGLYLTLAASITRLCGGSITMQPVGRKALKIVIALPEVRQ